MRVKSIDFLRRRDNTEQVVQHIETPLKPMTIKAGSGVNAVRIVFTQDYAIDLAHKPNTHGPQDPDFKLHNVQVVRLKPLENQLPYLPGTLTLEQTNAVRFDVIPQLATVAVLPPWPVGTFQLFLRGSDDTVNNRPGLSSTAGFALDGEPMDPSAATGGAISGDGTPGGDFTFAFVVA